MGHYCDIREEYERKELEARARITGRTPQQQEASEEHERKMREGRRLYEEMSREKSLIKYYQEHRNA